jgi:hypothetical protein
VAFCGVLALTQAFHSGDVIANFANINHMATKCGKKRFTMMGDSAIP